MGNCLITQLKGVIDNNNLPKFGELRITNTGSNIESIAIGYGGFSKEIYVINGHFTDSTGQEDLGTTQTLPSGNESYSKRFYITPGAILCLPDKYDIVSFITGGNVELKYLEFDEDSFSYCTKIKYLALNGLNMPMNISALKNMTKMTLFTLKGGFVQGDIANLSNLTKVQGTVEFGYNKFIYGDIVNLSVWKNVNVLVMTGTTISGSAKEFGDAMYNSGQGRVSGTLSFNCDPYGNNKPTVTFPDPNTQEEKIINSCIMEFTDSGVNYTPKFRA